MTFFNLVCFVIGVLGICFLIFLIAWEVRQYARDKKIEDGA